MRNRFAVLGLVALGVSACAQGVQDNMPAEDNVDLGGSGGTSGSGTGGSGTANAGHGGTVGSAGTTATTGGSAGTLGAAGTGGTVASGGKGGTTGTGGASAGTGGTASGGKGGTTGAGGTGGTVASGGKGGTTGTGGAGGTVASGGSGGSVSGNGISVQYKVVNSNAMSAYIECELHVKNAGPNTYALSDLKLRYYYTDDVKVIPLWNLNWSHIGTGGADKSLTVTDSIMAMVPTETNADTYLEFSFSSSDQSTVGPGQSLDFSWRFNGPDQAKDIYVQTNDYSFDASKTTQADWSHAVLLQNGTVVWGATP